MSASLLYFMEASCKATDSDTMKVKQKDRCHSPAYSIVIISDHMHSYVLLVCCFFKLFYWLIFHYPFRWFIVFLSVLNFWRNCRVPDALLVACSPITSERINCWMWWCIFYFEIAEILDRFRTFRKVVPTHFGHGTVASQSAQWYRGSCCHGDNLVIWHRQSKRPQNTAANYLISW